MNENKKIKHVFFGDTLDESTEFIPLVADDAEGE